MAHNKLVSPVAQLLAVVCALAFSLASADAVQSATSADTTQQASGADWPTYGFSVRRTGDNSADTVTAANAASLKLHWTHHAGGSIFSQPIVNNSLGMVFWGSWDGDEHATSISNNADVWATNLGTTVDNNCDPTNVGIASTATIGSIGATPVVFVGGGNARFYALNAINGSVIWSTSLGSSPSHFLWSSPALYNGSIYIGNASFGDCPLVQGQLVQLSVSTGVVQHIFNVVPNGCTGGGVWGSPTVDTSTGFVYFATGNPGSCASPYTEAVIKVFATDVSIIADSWQVRGSDKADLDFGSTPTLFPATIGGAPHRMVGIGNKDGMFYALNSDHMSQGTLWRANIAHTGNCPQCDSGTISPGAWDGARLYVAGGRTAINGVSCAGSLSALSPTGSFIWRHCLKSGPVLGAVSVSGSPGVVFVGQGTYITGIRASDGATLFRYNDLNSGSKFWGSPSISNGMVFIGNMDGNLYALGF
jgi:polyvinyl alcohol dehydrogenase (cytochrome)